MNKSNVDNYMQAMDELSSALQGDDERKQILDVVRMIVAAAVGDSKSYPFRPGLACRVVLYLDRMNARCDGNCVVEQPLFHAYLAAHAKLAEEQLGCNNMDRLMMLMGAHAMVDVALNTCSDNPCHLMGPHRAFELLDVCLAAT